jgi:uncharacterized protein DUF2380
MGPRQWVAGLVMLVLAQMALPGLAAAAQKIAIFPIDMSFPTSEEDFFRGVRGPSPDEKRRLETAYGELVKRVTESGRYEIVDLAPVAKEIADGQPFYNCNGCEIDIAKKVGADLVMTSVVEKISETHLSLTVGIVDVAKSSLVSTSSVLIQGNTDESWLHGVKWLAKNRLFAEAKPK